MKTAISVPDDLFHRVEVRAAKLRMNRSEFFATAADHYLRELDRASVTAAMDAAIERSGSFANAEDEELLEHNRLSILESTADDEW